MSTLVPSEAQHKTTRLMHSAPDHDTAVKILAESEARAVAANQHELAVARNAERLARTQLDLARAEVERLSTSVAEMHTHYGQAHARAERAEADVIIALAKWNGALERAMEAEAETKQVDETAKAMIQIAEEELESLEDRPK